MINVIAFGIVIFHWCDAGGKWGHWQIWKRVHEKHENVHFNFCLTAFGLEFGFDIANERPRPTQADLEAYLAPLADMAVAQMLERAQQVRPDIIPPGNGFRGFDA